MPLLTTNASTTDLFSPNWGYAQTQLANAVNVQVTQRIQNQIGTSLLATSANTSMNLMVTVPNAATFSTQTMNIYVSLNSAATTYWEPVGDRVNTHSFTILKRSAESLARYEAHQREQARLYAEREAERVVASGKAEILLRRMLSSKQNSELDALGHFLVTAKNGQTYRIKRGIHSNVAELCPETGVVKKTFCVVPRLDVPAQDAMLAQKLLLEVDPERFLRIAQRLD